MNGSTGIEAFGILVVCTGNICRSPLGEQLLRSRLDSVHGIEVQSAGLDAVVGAPMDSSSAQWSRRFGGDPTTAVGQQLERSQIDASSLVLTMTVGQRDELVRRFPSAMLRTFTLAEFATVLPLVVEGGGPVQAGEIPAAVRRCVQQRYRAELTPEDDVVDPIGADPEVHERAARHIDVLIRGIVEVLDGA
ncbi:hypothetical protein [Brachybacterium massiliense]|uniref:arsenate reductase/protein-tyrosine-phosphatase family protein n=1 Tax=Brachybacterium massiliense TaxID=1755098 RepID=UPI000B3BB683|nr:hypothetical protein [Brachybacterium massiliense]